MCSAEGLAYDSIANVYYFVINQNFGTFTLPSGALNTTLASPPDDVEGLAVRLGQVYAVTRNSSTMYKYNPGSDTWSVVGNTGVTFVDPGLAYDPIADVFYGKGIQDSNLYRLNPLTGAATVVGDTGITGGGGLAFLPTEAQVGPKKTSGTPVPMISPALLVILAAMIGAIGLAFRRRARR